MRVDLNRTSKSGLASQTEEHVNTTQDHFADIAYLPDCQQQVFWGCFFFQDDIASSALPCQQVTLVSIHVA